LVQVLKDSGMGEMDWTWDCAMIIKDSRMDLRVVAFAVKCLVDAA